MNTESYYSKPVLEQTSLNSRDDDFYQAVSTLSSTNRDFRYQAELIHKYGLKNEAYQANALHELQNLVKEYVDIRQETPAKTKERGSSRWWNKVKDAASSFGDKTKGLLPRTGRGYATLGLATVLTITACNPFARKPDVTKESLKLTDIGYITSGPNPAAISGDPSDFLLRSLPDPDPNFGDYAVLGDNKRNGGEVAAKNADYLIKTKYSELMNHPKLTATTKAVIEDLHAQGRSIDPFNGVELTALQEMKEVLGDQWDSSYDALMASEVSMMSALNKISSTPTESGIYDPDFQLTYKVYGDRGLISKELVDTDGTPYREVYVNRGLGITIPRAAVLEDSSPEKLSWSDYAPVPKIEDNNSTSTQSAPEPIMQPVGGGA